MARLIFISFGLLCLLLMAGFAYGQPWATRLWPWPDGPMSYLFVASMLAALAAGSLLAAWTKEWNAAIAEGIILLVSFGGMAATVTSLATERGGLIGHAVAFWLMAAVGIGLIVWGRRQPRADPRPLPWVAWLAAWLFTIVALIIAILLLRGTATIFPWPLKPETSLMYGWILLGLSATWLYAALWGRVGVTQILMAGFLAYDLVLIVPWLKFFARVAPAHHLSLILYTTVLCTSGAIAIYCLAFDRTMRLGRPAR